MSRLEELIQELCPNGVEYKTIEELCEVQNGYTPSKKISEYWDNGDFPWLRMEDIRANGKELSDSIQHVNLAGVKGKGFPAYSIIFATTATIGEHALITVPFICNQQLTHIHIKEDVSSFLDIRFLFYYSDIIDELCKKNTKGGSTLPAVSLDKFKKFLVPVPPLEIQREIVRILDNFTSLKAELQAELQARKKQYEYYRDKLLSFASDIPLFQLGKVCDLQAGKAIKASEISDIETNQETIPCYGANGLRGYVGKSNQKGDKSIIGRQGAQCGNVCYATGKYYATEHAVVVTDKGYFNSRYLFHVLTHANLNQYKTAGAQPGLSVSKLNNVMIAVPDKKVQDKIANILDNFEKICSDLNIGLPAEIEARQKQYEFYRDALLSFDNSYFVNVERERERDEWHSGLIKLWQYVFGYAPVKLKDIATISRGGNFQKKDFVKTGKPCIHYGQMYTHFGVYADKTLTFVNNDVFAKSKTAKPGDIVMAVTSENVEDVCSCTAWLGNEEIAVSGHTAIISHNQNAKYMSYFFHSASFFEQKKRLAHGTKVIEVTPVKLGDIKIMLPTLKEQERIVSILDRFDSLCNDISSGLPAEIEARQKQYEYYRDKLLSF